MSSVQPFQGILKSAESKTASKKNVSFDDTAERYSIRKPVQVLNFARGLTASLREYFSERDIGDASTLKAEASVDTELRKKFSHNTDLCIVFSLKDFSLSFFRPEIHANLEKLRAKNLQILQIEVKRNSSFSDYIEETIGAVKKFYEKNNENSEITQLKDGLAQNASTILSQLGTASIEFSKRAAFRDLIRLYVAINSADSEAILGYYQSYHEKLIEIDNRFDSRKEKAELFGKDFPYLKLYDETISELQRTVNEDKRDAWNQFLANIRQHYPQQFTQQPIGSVTEDSQMMEVINERTAFVTTLVEDKIEVEVLDEIKDPGEEPKKINPTPFWAAQPAQTAEKTATERLTELTM